MYKLINRGQITFSNLPSAGLTGLYRETTIYTGNKSGSCNMKVLLRTAYIRQMLAVMAALSFTIMSFASCESKQPMEEVRMELQISSSAFEEGGRIPAKYSCQGEDVLPPLRWDEPPGGTQSFVLIMDDPDAPSNIFTHWVLFNIPSATRQLPEAIPSTTQLSDGSSQGKNDFGEVGYGGPCPPPGRPHQYRFTLYGLDQMLELKAGASKKQVLEAMEGHLLGQGQLTGSFQR